MSWDLWIDHHHQDVDGYTHASTKDVVGDASLVPGSHIIVGNADADPAVAEVVSVEPDGVVLVRVLPGPAEHHLHLLDPGSLTGSSEQRT